MPESTETVPRIGFPPPLLGQQPQRLDVLAQREDWFALYKPAQVNVVDDPWARQAPSLARALNTQALEGKPELQRLGIPQKPLRSPLLYDGFISGPTLWTWDEERFEQLSNDYGSELWMLDFHFLTPKNRDREPRRCDLPLARHRQQPRSLVSHKTGKKAATDFHWLGDWSGWACWSAQTAYYRPHQVLLHAAEVELPVVGDQRYGRQRLPYLSDFKRDFRISQRGERPLYPGPVLHLASVRMGRAADAPVVMAPPPPAWEALRKIRLRYGR